MEVLVEKLLVSDVVVKVEIVGFGFINFFMSIVSVFEIVEIILSQVD